jgi:Holliday junction resolvase RusA-like endonuclease
MVATINTRTRVPIVSDPDKERKKDIANWIAQNIPLPPQPFQGALALTVSFFMPMPTSISNRERQRRLTFRWALESKKDSDNMNKLYQDALQTGPLEGKVFVDDHQICETRLRKLWATDRPGILIELEEITEPPADEVNL